MGLVVARGATLHEKGRRHDEGFPGNLPIAMSGHLLEDQECLEEAEDYQVIVPGMDPELTGKAVDAAEKAWGKSFVAGLHDCQRFAATVYVEYLRLRGRREENLPGWFEQDMKAAERPEPETWDDFRRWLFAPLEAPAW